MLQLGRKASFIFSPGKRKSDVGKKFSKLFLKCGIVMNQGLFADKASPVGTVTCNI